MGFQLQAQGWQLRGGLRNPGLRGPSRRGYRFLSSVAGTMPERSAKLPLGLRSGTYACFSDFQTDRLDKFIIGNLFRSTLGA